MTTQKEAQFTDDEKLWYQALIQSMNDGFGVIDENNVFTYVNSKFAQMLEYSEDEMVGKVLTSFVNVENKQILKDNIEKRTIGSASQYELEWTSKSGKQIPTIVSGTPLIDENNEHRGSFAVITDITELKEAEDALRESEHRLELALKGADLGTWDWIGTTGEMIFSERWAEILGFSLDEITPHIDTWRDLIHPDDQDAAVAIWNEHVAGQAPLYSSEHRMRTKSGEYKWVLERGKVVEWTEDNKTRRATGTILDITDRKVSEEALKKSEELFRRTFEAIPSPAYVWKRNDEGRIILVMVNRTIITYSKGMIEKYIGKEITELFSKDPSITEMVQHTFDTGEPVRREYHYENHPSSSRWIVCNVNKPAENAVLMIMTDITEIKNAADVLRERIRRLELISRISQRTTSILELDDVIHQAVNLIRDEFDYYAVSMFLVNTHEIILRAATHPKIKHREDEFRLRVGSEGIVGWVHARGKPLLVQDVSKDARYYPAPELPDTQAELAVPIKLKGKVIGILDVQSSEMEAFSEQDVLTLQAIADQLTIVIENARLYEAAQNEIIERKRAEDALRKTSNVSDLYLDLMSHDITNQLQVILGAISLLQHTCTDTSLLGLVSQIHTSAKKCARVISKVKATDGLLTSPMEPKSIDIILRECVYRIYSTNRDIKLETNIAISNAIILADKFLEHMLINLLENAIEHNPYPDRLLRVTLVDKENGYELTISDNGPGIPDKQKNWLFDVDRRFGGVGLHQVKQIVEKYGGKIEVLDRIHGDPRQGAQFRVWLPKAES
jgi:PAS domain S-box-containing protein